MRRIIFLLTLHFWMLSGLAQQYTGMSGLINVPSAEMDTAGDARIGAHFLNKEFLPVGSFADKNGRMYDTFDFYLSLTPFRWMEIGYTTTLFKTLNSKGKMRYNRKDRYFSLKFNPLREGKYYPSVAIGTNDFMSASFKDYDDASADRKNGFFCNYYIALTKHLDYSFGEIGATAVYRHFTYRGAKRWDGLVGGITYRPGFARNLRAIVEWTGCDINVGADCLLWKHLLLQASLQNGRYPSGGICYKVNLF